MTHPCCAHGKSMPRQLESLNEWLATRATQTPLGHAYSRRTSAGEWIAVNWGEVYVFVQRLSTHLSHLGLMAGDRAVIMMPTVPEWEYCHLGVLGIGGVVVGLDAHDAPDNIRHILHTVKPRALFLATSDQLDLLLDMLPVRPPIVVTLSPCENPGVISLQTLLESSLDSALPTSQIAADALATIIFTSGSTGQPKGIAYTHRQLCLAVTAILSRFPTLTENARLASWLPLSNLFQRIINLCAMVQGTPSYFVASPAEIVKRLPEIRPALLIGVPRFYEKLYAGLQAEVYAKAWPLRTAIGWAWRVGERYQALRRQEVPPSLTLRLAYALANHFILQRLRAVAGRDLKFMVSGSAPMPIWLLEKLHGMGWLVLEAYGISECVVPIANNTPDVYRFGSVGKPLPQNEIRFAEDGELLVRGPGVFGGYYENPETSTTLDAEGYLHTGDFARQDEDGFIWLTGRKSEVFKTSTGRRIAPVPIESAIKRLGYVEHAVVFGRNRPFPIVLLNIDLLRLPTSPGESPLSSEVLQSIGHDLEKVCVSLPSYQRPAGALLVLRPFSVAMGELTSNLKLKRGAIEEKYLNEISTLYEKLVHSPDHSQCLVQEVA